MKKHVSGVGYLLTYLGLIALATLSLGLSFLHWSTGDLVISLVIAAVKATLVFWFFMHLHEQRFANRMVVLVSFAMVSILIALMALDVASRHTDPPAPRPSSSTELYRR